VYGPRTTLVVALPGAAPRSVVLTLHGEAWEVTHAELKLRPEGKTFAPGNLRATADNPKYKALVDYWIAERYTLRCVGARERTRGHVVHTQQGWETGVL
jgi:sedoheptulose-bisphosphatase